jgi:hypothetical protein
MQEEEPAMLGSLQTESKKHVSVIQWNCPSCTLVNVVGTTKCELCDTLAPSEACETEGSSDRQQQDSMRAEVQPPSVNKTVSTAAELTDEKEKAAAAGAPGSQQTDESEVSHFTFLNLLNQPVAPLVIGALFADGKLRIRHFAYTANYLRMYVTRNRDDTGAYSLITGDWIRKDSPDTIQRALWGHNGELINSLS